MVVVNAAVHDLRDLVHEEHDPLLEHRQGVVEVPDRGDADDDTHLLARAGGVHRRRGGALHVAADDLGPNLAEAQREQSAELDDCFLQHDRLHGLLRLFHIFVPVDQLPTPAHLRELLLAPGLDQLLAAVLEVPEPHRLQRVVLDGLHFRDHAFDGIQQQLVGVLGEGHGAQADGEAYEYGLQHVEARLHLRRGPDVEREQKAEVLLLIAVQAERHREFPFRAPQALGRRTRRLIEDLGRRLHRDADEALAPLLPFVREALLHCLGERLDRRVPARPHEVPVPLLQREPALS
mmetsp:Transcript_75240/g.230190  ORF Transcript_75240/g.230190 Transcript_75240/m.230190 type:complete len:292 (-) Transcript_75240:471-1346(-)